MLDNRRGNLMPSAGRPRSPERLVAHFVAVDRDCPGRSAGRPAR